LDQHDFAGGQRLLRQRVPGELILSFVPDAEQRGPRTIARAKVQLVRDRMRLQNQLEELRIKSSWF
jgi:hypothetical protein